MPAPRCISCGYDLAGLTRGHRRGVRCPECGEADAARRPPGMDRRAAGIMMVGAATLLFEAMLLPMAGGASPRWAAAVVLALPTLFAGGLFVWAARLGGGRIVAAAVLAGLLWLTWLFILIDLARS